VLATPAVLGPLVELAGVADRVHPVAGLDELGWTEEAPQLAVNLHGRGPQSSRLLIAQQPERLVAFRCAEATVDGPVWRFDEHEVARWCRLVRQALAFPADPADLGLVRPNLDPPLDQAVVIHPGAAFPARRWPAERYAEVAAWAAGQGFPIAVTGSAAESELAHSVAAAAGSAATVLAGKTSLLELAALVSRARLVVSGDTGVAHLATAYRTPSVVLFGPVAPQLWGPPADGPHVALGHGDRPGDPWGRTVDPALLAISADEVIDAVERLLAETHASRP
jgi:ADP-heptose:LPS heptosyltransferase